MRNKILLLAAGIFLIQFYGCDKINFGKKKEEPKPVQQVAASTSALQAAVPAAKGTVIATVDGYPVTQESLDEEINRYNGLVPEDKPESKIDTKEKKIAYLKNEVARRVLLYQEAEKRGLDKSSDVLKGLEDTKQQLLVLQLVKDEMNKVNVSNSAIEDYYNTYKDQFKEPEERRIREIVVATEGEAKAALAKLLLGEEEFASMATRISKSESAAKGGDLDFIKRGDMKSEEFDRVAFSDAIEPGQTSQYFKGPKGYYILKLEAKKGGKQKSLSEIWDDLKKGLVYMEQQKRLEEVVKNLMKNAKVEIKESEIK